MSGNIPNLNVNEDEAKYLFQHKKELFGDFPVVFIGGLLQFTDSDLVTRLYNSVSYNSGKDREIIHINVGKFSSAHDNACKTFFQLKGGMEDFGEPHSSQCGHSRYGRNYNAYYPQWNSKSKVWIVTHSFGSKTVMDLQHKLATNFFREHTKYGCYNDPFNQPDPNEKDPKKMFPPTNEDWIAGIIFLTATFNGAPLMDLNVSERSYKDNKIVKSIPSLLFPIGYIFSCIFLVMNKLLYNYPFSVFKYFLTFFEWNMDEWLSSKYSWLDIFLCNTPYHCSNDNILYDLTTYGSNEANKKYKLYDCTFYYSFCSDINDETPFGMIPTSFNIFGFFALLNYYLPLKRSWYNINKEEELLLRRCDGATPLYSQMYPRHDKNPICRFQIYPDETSPMIEPKLYYTLRLGVMNVQHSAIKFNHLEPLAYKISINYIQRFWDIIFDFMKGKHYFDGNNANVIEYIQHTNI